MYADHFILIPCKTYASDEKGIPQYQVLHNPSICDKLSQLKFLEGFRE